MVLQFEKDARDDEQEQRDEISLASSPMMLHHHPGLQAFGV